MHRLIWRPSSAVEFPVRLGPARSVRRTRQPPWAGRALPFRGPRPWRGACPGRPAARTPLRSLSAGAAGVATAAGRRRRGRIDEGRRAGALGKDADARDLRMTDRSGPLADRKPGGRHTEQGNDCHGNEGGLSAAGRSCPTGRPAGADTGLDRWLSSLRRIEVAAAPRRSSSAVAGEPPAAAREAAPRYRRRYPSPFSAGRSGPVLARRHGPSAAGSEGKHWQAL